MVMLQIPLNWIFPISIAVLLIIAVLVLRNYFNNEKKELEREEYEIQLAKLNHKVFYPEDLYPPAGPCWDVAEEILSDPHILIAGTTGSGKSVLLNALIYHLMNRSPEVNRFLFVDLKKVELVEYANIPHTIGYCTKTEPALIEMSRIVKIMNDRYTEMSQRNIKQYEGGHIWVIIDEMADLLQGNRLSTAALCTKIVRLGRAANIHLIAATQNPTRDDGGGLPKDVAQNFTASVALRCRSEIESINIMGKAGAENLPQYGKGYLWNSFGIKEIDIPYVSKENRAVRIKFWTDYAATH